MLGGLALNAPGTTPTHALLPGSPALDIIPRGVNGCGTEFITDQRGVTRAQGSGCDAGAFELERFDETPPVITATVTDLSSVTPTVENLSCGLEPTANEVAEEAAGASGLQNLGDGYYQYNWTTPRSYANSCKTLKLDLGEGVFRTALFKFTR